MTLSTDGGRWSGRSRAVGVDPLLRREFWAHFRDLAEKGVTILVSSHVMDEAARCDRAFLALAEAKA